ncbi:MAG: hypothetical protein ACM3UV_08100, partial [Nocardioidaceae bacterium]
GTTTLELTALRRPFLYFPLEGHLEQNLVVAKRLARHRAGQPLHYSRTTAQQLAQTIAVQLAQPPTWPLIPANGAHHAAAHLNQLLATASQNRATKRLKHS